MTDPLAQPLELPCGAVLPNRIVKAAMTEGIADRRLQPTERHERLYRRWSEGGSGMLLTGNVQIDRRVLERPGNVAIDVSEPISDELRSGLERWAKAGTVAGNHLWMQIAHAGRQSPRYVTTEPLAPSAVQLKLLGNFAKPRALRGEEILDFIERFAAVAKIARETGFTGVQIHGAHGYLLSSFLSPITNQREDAWGGAIENRARFLLEAIRATRKAVGDDFPIAVKLNSDDFRKGGFSHEDCLKVVELLNGETLDLLEISGGNYEQPKLLGYGGKPGTEKEVKRASTKAREAYFLDYAKAIREIANMPILLTGGFRSREGMEEALAEGACDLVGLGRPLCVEPDFPKRLLNGEATEAPRAEATVKLSDKPFWGGASPVTMIRLINIFGQQGWFYQQLQRMADGLEPAKDLGILSAFARYQWDEYRTAFRMQR